MTTRRQLGGGAVGHPHDGALAIGGPQLAVAGDRLDVLNPALGPSARVALELTEETALALAAAIHRAIDSAPEGLASKDQ